MKLAQLRSFSSFFGHLLLSLFGIGVNVFIIQNPLFGSFFVLWYLFTTAVFLGKILFPNVPLFQKGIFGFLVLFCEILLSGTALYYGYKITPFLSYLLLFVPVIHIVIELLRKKVIFKKEIIAYSLPPLTFNSTWMVLIADVTLLSYLFAHGTNDLAASPWLMVSPIFFILYFLATGFLFWNYRSNKLSATTYLLTSLHFFVGVSIAALIYPIGYGFDAFIHRATEQWIFEHGFILPKTPYYIGQYSLVVMLAHLSSLPIKFIDIYLVPILSSLVLPPVVMFSLKKFLSKKELYIPYVFWLVPFIPFLFFHLTTPHNLVVLITLLTIFCLLLALDNLFPLWILFLFSLAAIATHALVGVPLFVVLFFYAVVVNIQSIKQKKLLLFLLVIALALLLPVLFTLNAIRIHAPLPEVGNPLQKVPQFLEMFKRPYWYASTSPLYFEVLYFFEKMMVPIVLLLSLIGTFCIEKENKNKHFWIFTTSFLGFAVSAFTLASSIVFPDVVAYEQKDYPMRMLHVSVLFLLPSAMYAIALIGEKIQKMSSIKKNKTIFFIITLFVLSTLFTCVLYLSYPQRNAKVRFPGYNVTSSDVEAVKWIHERHTDYNYVVLANQLVSAAALDKYSFAKYFQTPVGELFYYAIPTGGKLYEYYGAMIYQGQKREYMDDLMNFIGVDTAYFVVDRYWADSDKIIYGAMATADEYHPIQDGKVWVFVYKKAAH